MKTDAELYDDKAQRIMQVIAERCAYYRANPSRFIEDFIPGIKLKAFQKILLWALANNVMAYIVASRGLGKTYVVAMYAIYKAILYPHSRVVCASYTARQGQQIVLKITEDFMQKSALLRSEIAKISMDRDGTFIQFKNGSIMRVAVAGESSRGLRSTVLMIDESRLVQQSIADSILRPMNAAPRERPYTNKPEYAHLIDEEIPQELYLSSAYYCQSEMFEKVKAFTANALTPNMSYFVCDLPYQLSIKEGILLRQTIENEMSEQTFNEITFAMEREGLFWGTAKDALFDFDVIKKQRVLVNGLHNLDYYRECNLKVPEKQNGEVRVLSVDIALMASGKGSANDATALIVHSTMPASNGNYLDNIVFIDTCEGIRSEELGLLIQRYFYQYNCDYLVIDGKGVGISIVDFVMSDHYDPVYGVQYTALNCMNNSSVAERCKSPNALRKLYVVEATAKLNNDMALALRSGFQNGFINLLVSDTEADDAIEKVRGYSKLTELQKAKLKLPYVQTSFLVGELVNLSHDVSSGYIKVKEKANMRKDRYSSLEYGYYFVQQLSREINPRNTTADILDMIIIRAPKKRA